MKKIIFLLSVFVGMAFSQSNNIDTAVYAKVVSITMTATIDTVDINFGTAYKDKFTSYMITASNASGADTIEVYTKSWDSDVWSQCAVVDLSILSSATTIASSTTRKDFIIANPNPYKIRLISTSNDASTTSIKVTGLK
jgi:hypothetical protein